MSIEDSEITIAMLINRAYLIKRQIANTTDSKPRLILERLSQECSNDISSFVNENGSFKLKGIWLTHPMLIEMNTKLINEYIQESLSSV